MIPKIIYTAWASDKPMPVHCQYIESWRRVMPDYEIRILGNDDVPDSSCTRAMLERGKFVTAAQYAAFRAVHETGGIYMDLDVEVVRPFDDLLADEMFLGAERDTGAMWANCAVFGARKGHPFLAECLEYMDACDPDRAEVELELGPRMFTNLLGARGWDRSDRDAVCADVSVYASECFYPYRWDEPYRPECVTERTLAVHRWAGTWLPDMVSIVIPCYDHGEYLVAAIESAIAQTHRPLDIIVVNDGSTDDTSAVARRYPVLLIEQENRGLSAARNVGIAQARGRYILCLDADDVLEPTAIADMIGLDDVVCPSVLTFGATESPWIPPLAHPTVSDFATANHAICASLYRREVWEQVGGYDEAMRDGGEDWDFWTRAAGAEFTFTVVSDLLLRYRVYDHSRAARPNSSDRLRETLTETTAYMRAKWAALGIT